MSLGLVKKNSNSPFRLQRSMVDQGGEGGAYESGGYNPNAVYDDGGIAESIAGFGKVIGAGLGSRTAADDNASDIRKSERLGKKEARLHDKKLLNSDNENLGKRAGLEKREEKVSARKKAVDARINAYNEIDKPTLKSDVGSGTNPVKVNNKVTTKPEDESGSKVNIGNQLKTDYSSNANLKPAKKSASETIKKLFPSMGSTF